MFDIMNARDTGVIKSKSSVEIWTEHVAIPTWITKSESFRTSVLHDLLFSVAGSSESFLNVRADPLSVSSESMKRLVSDVTRGWLEENLTDPVTLEPQEYLFGPSDIEPVPTGWLEHLYTLPVHDDHQLVMDQDFDQ